MNTEYEHAKSLCSEFQKLPEADHISGTCRMCEAARGAIGRSPNIKRTYKKTEGSCNG